MRGLIEGTFSLGLVHERFDVPEEVLSFIGTHDGHTCQYKVGINDGDTATRTFIVVSMFLTSPVIRDSEKSILACYHYETTCDYFVLGVDRKECVLAVAIELHHPQFADSRCR